MKKNLEKTRNTDEQLQWYNEFNDFVGDVDWPILDKLAHFPVFSTRQMITRFIEAYELYKIVRNVPGNFVECGVGSGSFLMSLAHFSSIFEPFHYTRKIVGFDTFEGFTEPYPEDKSSNASHMKKGGLSWESYEILLKTAKFYDQNRPLGHMEKIELVKGDISETLPQYIESNPSLIVGLLHLDLDLYKPTKDTIELLLKRIPKGGMIIFDEPNHTDYPGETIAMMEALGINNLRLQRLEMSPMAAYAIIE